MADVVLTTADEVVERMRELEKGDPVLNALFDPPTEPRRETVGTFFGHRLVVVFYHNKSTGAVSKFRLKKSDDTPVANSWKRFLHASPPPRVQGEPSAD